MVVQPDVEIRRSVGWAIYYLVGGLVWGGFGVLIGRSEAGALVVGIILALFGFGLAAYSAVRLTDKSVKLSLTDLGLFDHRTGTLILWWNIRSVRLHIDTFNNIEQSATMYIFVFKGLHDDLISIDVHGLDHSAEVIAQLVQKRALPSILARGYGSSAAASNKIPRDRIPLHKWFS